MKCRSSKIKKPKSSKIKSQAALTKLLSSPVYSNVHAILNPEKVYDRLNSSEFIGMNNSTTTTTTSEHQGRKLSVLMMGIDSVSRLNFQRTMPLTKEHLDKQGWLELRGYNKMGDNTYPNLMAFLTGFNESRAFSQCNPYKPYGLDSCPFIWYGFRDAGYITGYGEDTVEISTFNYLKVRFKLVIQ